MVNGSIRTNLILNKWSCSMIKIWLDKFRTWLVERQAAKFAKELKEKNYEIRKPWNNGVWK